MKTDPFTCQTGKTAPKYPTFFPLVFINDTGRIEGFVGPPGHALFAVAPSRYPRFVGPKDPGLIVKSPIEMFESESKAGSTVFFANRRFAERYVSFIAVTVKGRTDSEYTENSAKKRQRKLKKGYFAVFFARKDEIDKFSRLRVIKDKRPAGPEGKRLVIDRLTDLVAAKTRNSNDLLLGITYIKMKRANTDPVLFNKLFACH